MLFETKCNSLDQLMFFLFDNQLANAVDAMPQGGNLTINSQIHQDNLGVTFTDTGLGIPLEVIEKLWTFILHDKNEGVGTWLAKC